MKPFTMVLLLAGSLLLAGASQTATPQPVTPSASAPPDAVVHIKQFSYVPQARTIKPGQTIQWVNDDYVDHSVSADDDSFHSGELAKGNTWSHTFTVRGTYTYACDDHEYMKGSIIVK